MSAVKVADGVKFLVDENYQKLLYCFFEYLNGNFNKYKCLFSNDSINVRCWIEQNEVKYSHSLNNGYFDYTVDFAQSLPLKVVEYVFFPIRFDYEINGKPCYYGGSTILCINVLNNTVEYVVMDEKIPETIILNTHKLFNKHFKFTKYFYIGINMNVCTTYDKEEFRTLVKLSSFYRSYFHPQQDLKTTMKPLIESIKEIHLKLSVNPYVKEPPTKKRRVDEHTINTQNGGESVGNDTEVS